MKNYFKNALKGFPILSYPCVSLLNENVFNLTKSSKLQALGMIEISKRFDTLASVSYMDLSVEAEMLGCLVEFKENEIPNVIKGIDTIDNFKITNGRKEIILESLKEAKKNISKKVFAGMVGPFTLASRLMDMSELFVGCYEEKEKILKLLDNITNFLDSYLKEIKNTLVDGVLIACPVSGLLSFDLIEEFSTPFMKKLIENNQSDTFSIIYHNCGNVIPLYESIKKTNAFGYHFGNCIDIEKILEIEKDVLIMGNIDPLLFTKGNEENVYKKTLDLLNRCGKYQNFIISTGCDLPPSSSIECIDYFFKAIKDYYGELYEC